MEQQEKKVEHSKAIEHYGKWLLRELQTQGIVLLVVGENSLSIKGEMTAEQRENIKLWKRQLIDALSPKCSNCALPMNLIDSKSWFCPIGCQSKEVK